MVGLFSYTHNMAQNREGERPPRKTRIKHKLWHHVHQSDKNPSHYYYQTIPTLLKLFHSFFTAFIITAFFTVLGLEGEGEKIFFRKNSVSTSSFNHNKISYAKKIGCYYHIFTTFETLLCYC